MELNFYLQRFGYTDDANDTRIDSNVSISSIRLGGIKVGDGLDIDSDGTLNVVIGDSAECSLKPATSWRLGGVKVGDGLEMVGDTLNVTLAGGSDYSLPTASSTRKGGVKVGDGLEAGS